MIEPESEEINEEEVEDSNKLSLNFKSVYGDFEKLYRSYVVLERLSPNDIQHLL